MAKHVHDRFLPIADALSPALAGAVRQVGPVSLSRGDDRPFAETLARAVASQQLSVKAAAAIWGRVEARVGDQPLCAFLRQVGHDDLRACGLSGAKAKTLAAIGEAEEELDADRLAAMDAAARAEAITALWGVGPWTADMMNMFYFGEEDIWPDGDVAARNWLKRLTSPRRKTARTAARFAPHRSYLAVYMWRYADADLWREAGG